MLLYKRVKLSLLFLIFPMAIFSWEFPQIPDCSKIEAAPTYVHMDILENGKTIHKMDTGGIRLDGTFVFYNGITVKPSFMATKNNGSLYVSSLSLGYTLPLSECIIINPLAGLAYSYLSSHIHREFLSFHFLKKQCFKTYSPFIELDAVYRIGNGWRFGGGIQYAWANSKTTIGNDVHNHKSEASGFAYFLNLEKDITENISLTMSGGYNNSMSKEKHGLRGYGGKAGVAYWF